MFECLIGKQKKPILFKVTAMGLLKQLMIFGELWNAGASHARAPIPENISGWKLTQVLNSVGSVLVHQETTDWGGV